MRIILSVKLYTYYIKREIDQYNGAYMFCSAHTSPASERVMPHPRGHKCNKAHYRGVAMVTHQWEIMPVSCMANHAITAYHAT